MRIYQFKYVDRFKCDGNICNAQCCGANWTIYIDHAAYKKIHWIKNQSVRNKILSSITKTADGKNYCIKLDKNGKCPLVCKDNLCYIQRNLGADALSTTCQIYPRKAVVLGDCQLRSLSMTCPVAAEEALFGPDGMVLETKNIQAESSWELVLRRLKKRKISDTKAIDSVIIGGISILQNMDFTREERMVLLCLFFDRLDDMNVNDDTSAEIINIALEYQTERFKAEARKIMSKFSFYMSEGQQVMRELIENVSEHNQLGATQELLKQIDNYGMMYDKWRSPLENQYGRAIDNFWLQEFLHHGYPFRFEGSFVHNCLVYILSYKIWEIIIYGYIDQVGHIFTKNVFMLAINTFSRIMDHKRKFLPIINEKATELEKEPLKAMQMLLRLK